MMVVFFFFFWCANTRFLLKFMVIQVMLQTDIKKLEQDLTHQHKQQPTLSHTTNPRAKGIEQKLN